MDDKQQIAELGASLAERDARLAERDASLAELEASLLERDARLNGTFYSRLLEVWRRTCSLAFTQAHFYDLLRTNCPDVYAYTTTVNAAAIFTNTVASDTDASKTTDKDFDREKSVWRVDVFGEERDNAQIAHLIPVSSGHAGMYDDVATWVLGLTPEILLDDQIHLLIDDDKKRAAIAKAKQMAIHGARKNGDKVPFTGLKHSPANKMRLRFQKELMDNHPCLVIVPVMDLEHVKAWNGEGYSAIVLPEAWEDNTKMKNFQNRTTIKEVCEGCGMLDKVEPTASPAEIEVSRKLLEQVLCGMAFSLLMHDRTIPKESLQAFETLQKTFSNVVGGVTVPSEIQDERVCRVRMVTFGRVGERVMHPAPDPLLLAVKAAVVWSTRHEQQLLAGGEVVEDDADSLSIQAEEEYLQKAVQSYRPDTWEDLAAGLNQSNGFRAQKADPL
jgi:hypothetical protein